MKNAMQLKAIMKKLAKENQISAQLVLQNYMLERFLERVSLSPYRDNYIIKGGFLISSMVGLNSRATMDMDATIKGYPVTQDAVQKMIEQILTVPVDDDITFTYYPPFCPFRHRHGLEKGDFERDVIPSAAKFGFSLILRPAAPAHSKRDYRARAD